MQSLGEWYKAVPKNPAENLRYRRHWWNRGESSRRARETIREVAANDILWWINTWVWTYDPRKIDVGLCPDLPFITYPAFQDPAFLRILRAMRQGTDLCIEKSRDMGASWICLSTMEWAWHWHRGTSFLMISRKEELVDQAGDKGSLFVKIDHIHDHLPDWLMPGGDRGTYIRRKLNFENPVLGSSVNGETTTKASGVGDRQTAVFVDEFSRIEHGHELEQGLHDVTRCIIFNFTPYGTNNAAARLAKRTDISKLRFHWSEHPEKSRGLYQYNAHLKRVLWKDDSTDEERQRIWKSLWPEDKYPGPFVPIEDGRLRSPWYDFECRRRGNPREIAMMLDIDYQGSTYQFFTRETIEALQEQCSTPSFEGDVVFDPDTGDCRGLVRHSGGPLKIWCPLDGELRPRLDYYGAGADLSMGTGATNSCLSMVNLLGVKVLEYTSPALREEQFALRSVALCRWFAAPDGSQGALLCWEIPGPGIVFGKKVLSLGYTRVFWKEKNPLIPHSKRGDRPGWTNTPEAADILLTEYRDALWDGRMVNRSEVALGETLFFIVDEQGHIVHSETMGGPDADPTGARVNHGDRAYADAQAWKMAKSLGAGLPKKKEPDARTYPVLSLGWRREYHRQKEAATSDDGW